MNEELVTIFPGDTVAVALEDLPAGYRARIGASGHLTLIDAVPFGHKVALEDIPAGGIITKYGAPIGHAVTPIARGQHVHVHNCRTNLGDVLEYTYLPDTDILSSFGRDREYVFDGYARENGSAGTRNEVWIIPTVGCVNNTAQHLARLANERFASRCDGVFAYGHTMGCSQMGNDHAVTQELLAGLIAHPNAGGVLVLSLGCENNNLDVFTPVLEQHGALGDRVRFLVTQDADDEYAAGLALLDELTAQAARCRRRPLSAEKLVLGFKCGGSDAFSGITANALCGRVNDRLVRAGGSTILTEVPEMFGAETRLMARAASEAVFEDIVRLINDYKGYFIRYGQTIYENPSPGNKAGGISTLEEKSLGCIQKGGQAPVAGVLGYGQHVRSRGLNLLTGSGNDQVSCTNLVASGANLVLFTTGRGTPLGTPVPTLKISSNSKLFERKRNWMDFNAGRILEGVGMEETADALMALILDVASGRTQTRNEVNGYRDISLFRDGVIL
ncbi:altronate dehydratase family protein [Desulfovibrio sp. OttesenSCG-928-I05]|nr:altronate dehydratase family protein [Desulfovibrio sp. OttesenSCG-928-I05]